MEINRRKKYFLIPRLKLLISLFHHLETSLLDIFLQLVWEYLLHYCYDQLLLRWKATAIRQKISWMLLLVSSDNSYLSFIYKFCAIFPTIHAISLYFLTKNNPSRMKKLINTMSYTTIIRKICKNNARRGCLKYEYHYVRWFV